MKTAIVLLAPGFEEIEAITPIDLLRRAGIEVRALSITDQLEVKGGHGLVLKADGLLGEASGLADVVVVPGGGGGSQALAASAAVSDLLRRQAASQALVAAICAAPAVVLNPLGLLEGRHFTCYPGMEKLVTTARFSTERTVMDGQIITSRAAGTAGEFSLAIIATLLGTAKADEIAAAILQSR